MSTQKLIVLKEAHYEHLSNILKGYIRQICNKLTDEEPTQHQRTLLYRELDKTRTLITVVGNYDII